MRSPYKPWDADRARMKVDRYSTERILWRQEREMKAPSKQEGECPLSLTSYSRFRALFDKELLAEELKRNKENQ